VAKVNHYAKPTLLSPKLESTELIFTYQSESLQHAYEAMFCGNLINCRRNIDGIKNAAQFASFNLTSQPIKNNHYQIESINLYRVIYNTVGQFGESEMVSGGVYIPVMPQHKIKGVILFFHPTFFAKSSVSSYNPHGRLNSSLAAIFASNGYIVVYPDYIGMGYNKNKVHPYAVYPQVNAADGLSMLAAFKELSGKLNLGFNKKPLPLFLTGYSEGSAYTLWFSRLYQEDYSFRHQLDSLNYQLRMVVPISGAYNLSSVVYNNLYSNNNW
jgi:hypothetical protein